MEEIPWRKSHGGNLMEEIPWKKSHGSNVSHGPMPCQRVPHPRFILTATYDLYIIGNDSHIGQEITHGSASKIQYKAEGDIAGIP